MLLCHFGLDVSVGYLFCIFHIITSTLVSGPARGIQLPYLLTDRMWLLLHYLNKLCVLLEWDSFIKSFPVNLSQQALFGSSTNCVQTFQRNTNRQDKSYYPHRRVCFIFIWTLFSPILFWSVNLCVIQRQKTSPLK